jgi:anaerobic magnesium-protoporphyrin IX monomethyl ester cyclase
MKILLLRPLYTINRYSRSVPLGYLHLASYLKENNHEPYILDMLFDDVTEDMVNEFITENDIDTIGIGCMTCEYKAAIEQAERLKKMNSKLRIIFGGAHPTGNPKECIETGFVDYAVVGEGEVVLSSLLTGLENDKPLDNIPGLWFKKDGQVHAGGYAEPVDVENLPLPAFDIIDLERYFALDPPWHFPKSKRVVQLGTSRGCPFNCSYCHHIHGKKARLMSAEKVVSQLETLYNKYKVREIIVIDDIFNVNLERAKNICKGLIEKDIKLNLQFPNGVRGDIFDEELMSLLKKAGTHYIAVAIETASERLQKLIRKNLKVEKALETVATAKKYGIEVGGFFLIGFPSETKEEVKETINLAIDNPFDVTFFSIVAPYEGTELRRDILNGHFGEAAQAAMKASPDEEFPVFYNPDLTREMLIKMRMFGYLRFYTKPARMFNLMKKMYRLVYIKQILRAIYRRLLFSKTVSVS